MTNKFKIKNLKLKINNGFTLVEMLIYMGLLSLFLVVLTEIFTSVLNIFSQTETTSSLEQDSRFIASRLAYDITRSSTILSPLLGGSQNNLSLQVGSENITYSISGNNLILTSNTGQDALNGAQTKISNLSFLRLGNAGGKNLLKVQFTLTSTREESKGPRTLNYQTTISQR